MSSDPPRGSADPPDDDRGPGRKAQGDAWGAFGLLVSGVAVWGGVGGLISHWTHHAIFVMIGLLVGMATALYGIWFRYGRS